MLSSGRANIPNRTPDQIRWRRLESRTRKTFNVPKAKIVSSSDFAETSSTNINHWFEISNIFDSSYLLCILRWHLVPSLLLALLTLFPGTLF